MNDSLIVGRSFRSFNVIDDFIREVLKITMDTILTANLIIRELEELVK